LAAAAIASQRGAVVASTTRNASRERLPHDYGASDVFVDDGSIHQRIRATGGADGSGRASH